MKDEESLFPELDVRFAKFWPRLGAAMIDGILLAMIVMPVTYFNVIQWKIPLVFIVTSLLTICYKPFLEYRFGATLGKMAVGIKVVGYRLQKVSLKEVLRRVSFYLVPSILQDLMNLKIYFSGDLASIKNFGDYNQDMISSNPAMVWLNFIVFGLLIADCITFFTNYQNRSLHDLYAGTYVIEKY